MTLSSILPSVVLGPRWVRCHYVCIQQDTMQRTELLYATSCQDLQKKQIKLNSFCGTNNHQAYAVSTWGSSSSSFFGIVAQYLFADADWRALVSCFSCSVFCACAFFTPWAIFCRVDVLTSLLVLISSLLHINISELGKVCSIGIVSSTFSKPK